MNEKRLEITETVFGNEYIPYKLTDYIAVLSAALASVPEEYKPDVCFELDTREEYGVWVPTTRAWYNRPESDDEYNRRVERERQRLAMRQHNNEILERREFERLQAKYGQKG